MKKHRVLMGMVAVALGLLVMRPAEGVEPMAGTPDATVGPLVSGRHAYVEGTYTWTDYAYDDTGANTDVAPGGDSAYPEDLTAGNAADLIQLQVRFDGPTLEVRAVLQTLLDPSVPVLRVGVDLDGDPATGTASLPGWAGVEALGLDAVVESTDADAGTNTVTARVDRSRLRGARQIRVVAAVGIAGSDDVYDLAFVRAEDICAMPADGGSTPCVPNPDNRMGQDHIQSDIIAGNAPVGPAVATVDLSKLASGATELPDVSTRGFHYLLYHSDLALGEGIRSSSGQSRARVLPHTVFAGPYQPYVVRLPRGLDAPMPTVLYLHGRSGNHLQGFVNNFANFDPDAAIIGVLGRGYDVGYGGVDWSGFLEPEGAYGEQDVLDVLDDATARGIVDPDRVVLGGISMGGVGSFFVSEMNPDRFAGVLPIVGGNGGITPANWTGGLMVENLHNLPLRMANGLIDPLGHAGSQSTPASLQALRTVDFRAWEAIRRHHEWQAGLIDCVWEELLVHERVSDPARVIYRVDPAFEITDPVVGLDRRHTSAYWVSGLRPRSDPLPHTVTSAPTSLIDVTTLARPVRTVEAVPVAEVGENFTAGADYCGPHPDLQSNDAWEMNGVILTPGPEQPTTNAAEMTLLRFETITLDLDRMSLDTTVPIALAVTGDGDATITLRGPWPAGEVEVRRNGDPYRHIPVTDGAVRLNDDFSGRNDYTFTPGTAP